MPNNLQIAMGNIKVCAIAALSFWCVYIYACNVYMGTIE